MEHASWKKLLKPTKKMLRFTRLIVCQTVVLHRENLNSTIWKAQHMEKIEDIMRRCFSKLQHKNINTLTHVNVYSNIQYFHILCKHFEVLHTIEDSLNVQTYTLMFAITFIGSFQKSLYTKFVPFDWNANTRNRLFQ